MATSPSYFRRLKLFLALNFSRLPLIFLLSLSWLFGSAAGIYLTPLLAVAGGLIILAVFLIKRGPVAYLSLFLIYLLAVLRLGLFSQSSPATTLDHLASREVNLQGTVDGPPRYYNQTQRLFMFDLKDSVSLRPVAGKIEITTSADVTYEPGQQLNLSGTLELTPGQGGRTTPKLVIRR